MNVFEEGWHRQNEANLLTGDGSVTFAITAVNAGTNQVPCLTKDFELVALMQLA